MSAAALAAPPAGRLSPEPANRSDGGRLTLEQLLEHAWEGLHAAGAADCPVCCGRMTRAGSAAAGRCADCGTRLG